MWQIFNSAQIIKNIWYFSSWHRFKQRKINLGKAKMFIIFAITNYLKKKKKYQEYKTDIWRLSEFLRSFLTFNNPNPSSKYSIAKESVKVQLLNLFLSYRHLYLYKTHTWINVYCFLMHRPNFWLHPCQKFT